MKVKQQLTRKYYKYITVESSWTQPVLSSNGTIGVDDFAVSASAQVNRAFHAFDKTAWRANNNTYLLIYSKNALCIKRLGFAGDRIYYVYNFTLYGSNDGTNWTSIQNYSADVKNYTTFEVNNNNFYNYYKFQVNNCISNNGYVESMQLTATQQTVSIVESTEDDYDFYKDKIALNAFIVNNVYKAKKF